MLMNDREWLHNAVYAKRDSYAALNDEIHGYAETSFEEYRSAAALIRVLKEEGFEVREGLADMPTCFTGTAGSGRPVIGILGEFDALDGLSQEAGVPVRKPVKEGAPGHGCGHCCLGTASLAAAAAVRDYLEAHHLSGTVVYFGCPAEEGAGSKQFMARAGLFDDVDFVYTWHPSTTNDVSADCTTAIMGANFEFTGISVHAGGSPWLGRSALDAAELMNVGCNYLREHIRDGQRIHYAYSDAGGSAPNVVPDHVKIKYEVRARTVAEVKKLFERVTKVARGAAMMTETEVRIDLTMAFSDFRNNSVLAETASACLEEIGAPAWDEEDYALARAFLNSYEPVQKKAIIKELAETWGQENLAGILEKPLHSGVKPYDSSKAEYEGGSTDVGDVSYAAPTCEIHTAAACMGNIGHTWQMAAQAGSRIGHKGLMTAAEAMALACIRMAADPEKIRLAKEETLKRNGGKYSCPLPDSVMPPVGKY